MIEILFYIIGAILVAWLLFRINYLNRKKKQYHIACTESFGNKEILIPKIKTSYSYSSPSFKIIFATEDQMNLAIEKGMTIEFESKIQNIHEDINDFEAGQAIYFTWKGRIHM